MIRRSPSSIFFFFNDTATTEIYTLSLHDALPIYLTVVPDPPLREAFERMRGTPPLLGWYPPRRRHVQREEFPDRPTMIGDPCRHGRRGLGPDMTQTRVRGAEVVDGTNEIHAMLQRQRATYQGPASARQRSEALTKRRIEPFDVGGIDDPSAVRAASERLDAGRRAIDHAALGLNHVPPLLPFDHFGDQHRSAKAQAPPPTPS